jgi:phage replication-related protein YjqB (UPF0714/DUF867 family)
VIALHGGLETGTERIAALAADRTGASLYTITQPPDLAWHIPSTRCTPADSPAFTQFLGHVRTVISVHGFGRPHLRRSVLVGGRNRHFRSEVAAALRHRTGLTVIDDPTRIPAGLRGRSPANPVNFPSEGGVQVELSPSARVAPELDAVVGALAVAIEACSSIPSTPLTG